MKNLIILIDYNNEFLISLNNKNKYVSMDLKKIDIEFSNYGFNVLILEFSQLDLNKDYKNYYILYQSSEKQGQYYKKYIEDLIYFLELSGAIVLPKYQYLKAHHNKGFMEILRNSFTDESLKTITSRYYGNPIEALELQPKLPVVIKRNSGAGSSGVYCAKTPREYIKYINKASNTIIGTNLLEIYLNYIKSILKKIFYKKNKNNIYNPFIIQNFVGNLSGDYKVLYFGGKYYTLYRKNRKKDFRASGSGLLYKVPIEDNYPLLNFARKVIKQIDFPIIGMDIGFDGSKYHLIEFQMIHLGPYTLQRSEYYFVWNQNQWQCISENSDLEKEFVRSISNYICERY